MLARWSQLPARTNVREELRKLWDEMGRKGPCKWANLPDTKVYWSYASNCLKQHGIGWQINGIQSTELKWSTYENSVHYLKMAFQSDGENLFYEKICRENLLSICWKQIEWILNSFSFKISSTWSKDWDF